MKRFVEGEDRRQGVLLPEFLDDYVSEENPVRVIDVFIEELDLAALGFEGVVPEATGRPAYHPGVLLKIYVYGYINQLQSSRRLERETARNVEMMWLTGRLVPDHKTIGNFGAKCGGSFDDSSGEKPESLRRSEAWRSYCSQIHRPAAHHIRGAWRTTRETLGWRNRPRPMPKRPSGCSSNGPAMIRAARD